MTNPLFASPSEAGKAPNVFGQTYNGRYHMPLAPGERGPKSGGQYVSRGCMRVSNFAGALEDTRALNVWEQALGLVGLVLEPKLYEELRGIVLRAVADGTDFEKLREYPALKEALAGTAHDQEKAEASIIGRAKAIAGANAASERGTADHDAWEKRATTGELTGSSRSRGQVLRTEQLLADAGLIRVPGLQERVVRNMTLGGATGRFDDVLMELSTGRLLIADLKTKATKFYSRTAVDIQLAIYARSELMLADAPSECGLFGPGEWYEPGLVGQVDQSEGVIMHVPSDGAPARLERADLVEGWEDAQLAMRIIKRRSSGRGSGRMSNALWVPKDLAQTS